MSNKNEDDDDDDDDPSDTSFIEDFDATFESTFKPLEEMDIEVDENDAFQNNQDLHIYTVVEINTSRLSSLFKGMDSIKVNLTIPVDFDFSDKDSLERTVEYFYQQLMDVDGPLIQAIIGNNVGVTEELKDAFGMQPPVISLSLPINPTIYCDDPEIDEHYNVNDDLLIEGLRKHLTPIVIEEVWKSCRSNYRYTNIIYQIFISLFYHLSCI